MVVFFLKKFPQKTRGLLSRYTLELHSGLFVGKLSKRLRSDLWDRISEDAPIDGFACMTWNTQSPQGIDIVTIGKSDYEIQKYDDLIMLSKKKS